MTIIRIIIEIEPGHGDQVSVMGPDAPRAPQTAPEPPFADELDPLPPEPGSPPTPFRGAAHGGNSPDLCPVHHMPWKTVPGGISKKTGKPYDSFRACPERGCTQRPAA